MWFFINYMKKGMWNEIFIGFEFQPINKLDEEGNHQINFYHMNSMKYLFKKKKKIGSKSRKIEGQSGKSGYGMELRRKPK